MKLIRLIILSITLSAPVIAQDIIYSLGHWNHTNLNGSVSFNGIYRNQENILRSGTAENPVTKQLNSEFILHSKSYIWHPNFMKVGIDLSYMPGVRNEVFLVIPKRSETRTAEQLRLKTIFFDERPLSLNFFTDLNHSYINREYTSSIKSYRKDFGVGLSFRNKYVPLSLNYLKADWDQLEVTTKRRYETKRENLHLEMNNSLSKSNRNQFSYNYDDSKRTYGFAGYARNYSHSLRLSNRFNFDKQGSLNSLITYRNQQGNQPLERWQIVENGQYSLPYNLKSNLHYRFSDYQQNNLGNRQNNISGGLEHQLFLSLKSRIFYEYINVSQNSYKDNINRTGLSFQYQKKIPTGLFKLGYEFTRRYERRNAENGSRFITAETRELSDDLTIILEKPYPEASTVVVWDEDRVIMYEENIDYILIPRGDYLEIQRLTGGNIPNGQSVSIDYRITQINSYNYNSHLHLYSAGINLFGRLLEGYFRIYDQDYDNDNINNIRILKTIHRQVYGMRLNWRYFTSGWEYNDYQSNIVPYRSNRLYINFSHTIFRSLDVYLSSSWRERVLTLNDDVQSFADISGRIGYGITRNAKVFLNGGYRSQDGRGINLDLSSIRMELNYRIRRIHISTGIDIYRRDFSREIINYQGGFLRVERKI